MIKFATKLKDMNTLNYHSLTAIQEFIWHSIKDLPQESIDEILNYVIYVRRKNLEPNLFSIEYEMLNEELHQKSKLEIQHLEKEFENYKIEFPNE